MRNIAFVAFPDFEMLDVCGPYDVFAFADRWLRKTSKVDRPVYQWTSSPRKPDRSDLLGAPDRRDHAYPEFDHPIDTLIVASGEEGMERACADAALIAWIRRRRHGHGGSHRSAVAPFCSPRPGYWMVGGQPRTGVSASNWRALSRRSASTRIGSSSGMVTSTPRAGSQPVSIWPWPWWRRITAPTPHCSSRASWSCSSGAQAVSPSSAPIWAQRPDSLRDSRGITPDILGQPTDEFEYARRSRS